MKYLLVDRNDEIISKVDLGDDVGLAGAKTYFQGVKKISNSKDFNNLWKVMTEKSYDNQFFNK